MTKARLEAFSDGVIAILITIMVLELKIPHEGDLNALAPLLPVFMSYVLSFIFLGIYWNNHHHMLHMATRINGRILWANLHLLFWLSLIPFVTGWMGENHLAPLPTATYGVVMFGAGVAYILLQGAIIADQRRDGRESKLARAVGRDKKGLASAPLLLASVPLAYVQPWISAGIFIFIAGLWLVPDRRIERFLEAEHAQSEQA